MSTSTRTSTRTRNHPASCTDPDCTLTYVQHLKSISVAAAALPTRKGTVRQKELNEERWAVDHPAFDRVYKETGIELDDLDGAAAREKQATNEFELMYGDVTIDHSDVKNDRLNS